MAEAIEWVAILTTIALEMVLPGLAGQWLDRRLGTKYLVLVGFVLGLSVGLWHLVQVTKTKPDSPHQKSRSPKQQESSRPKSRKPGFESGQPDPEQPEDPNQQNPKQQDFP